jgi:hypothetical protein
VYVLYYHGKDRAAIRSFKNTQQVTSIISVEQFDIIHIFELIGSWFSIQQTTFKSPKHSHNERDSNPHP